MQRARDLIQQMLTFSRGQHGEPRPLALSPLVGESLGLLKSTLPSSLEFTLESEQELPEVMADPVHIEQVLMNLCINARDAMQGSGRLDIALNSRGYRARRRVRLVPQTPAGTLRRTRRQ